MPDSSSTMRMLCMLANDRGGNDFSGYRQLHDETGSHRLVFLDSNGTVMILDDPADNSQAQSGSPLLGGKVRQEETLLQFPGNTVASVGNGNFDGVPAGHERRGDLNFSDQRGLHGLCGIV